MWPGHSVPAHRQRKNVCMDASQLDGSSLQPYYIERVVDEALRNCSASSSSPNGISYKVLKTVAQHLLAPLNIIFQQSLYADLFPATWKHAIITPLFEGRGDRSNPASYRPISICSCLGKLLERVMQMQLIEFLKFNETLLSATRLRRWKVHFNQRYYVR